MIYKPGQIVEGKITGIQPYGAFVALEHHVSGLIHISEISDGYVKDISKFVSVGDVVKLKVLECDDKSSHVKLSLKALQKAHFKKIDVNRWVINQVYKYEMVSDNRKC